MTPKRSERNTKDCAHIRRLFRDEIHRVVCKALYVGFCLFCFLFSHATFAVHNYLSGLHTHTHLYYIRFRKLFVIIDILDEKTMRIVRPLVFNPLFKFLYNEFACNHGQFLCRLMSNIVVKPHFFSQ